MLSEKWGTYIDIRENVSLIKLIANPEKYEGKRIQVIGFFDVESGDLNAIYLHQEDYKHGISENGFAVKLSGGLAKKLDLTKFTGRYVILIGTFNAKDKGPLNMLGGTLTILCGLTCGIIK